jgi:hypothetical protein
LMWRMMDLVSYLMQPFLASFLLNLPTRHDEVGIEFSELDAECKNIGFFILTSYFSYLNMYMYVSL